MGRTIVMCSDGTGNAFDAHITNVSRMIRLAPMSNPANGWQVTRNKDVMF
jgi:uncharacterized protein (DUF2235 family)